MDTIVLLLCTVLLLLLLDAVLLLDLLARRGVRGGLATRALDDCGVHVVRLSEAREELVHLFRRAVVSVSVDAADDARKQVEAGLVRLDQCNDALDEKSLLSACGELGASWMRGGTHIVLGGPAVVALAAVGVVGHDARVLRV